MKDYKKLSRKERTKISDHIKKTHKDHIEKKHDLEKGVYNFMDSFYKDLMTDHIIAEDFIMDRKVFDNEIAKSLSKIYSEELKSLANSKLNYNPQPNSLTKEEKAAVENLFKEKATKDQIKILTKKYKQKKEDARKYSDPVYREERKKKAEDYLSTPEGIAVKKLAQKRYDASEKGRSTYKKYAAKVGSSRKRRKKDVAAAAAAAEEEVTITSNASASSVLNSPSVTSPIDSNATSSPSNLETTEDQENATKNVAIISDASINSIPNFPADIENKLFKLAERAQLDELAEANIGEISHNPTAPPSNLETTEDQGNATENVTMTSNASTSSVPDLPSGIEDKLFKLAEVVQFEEELIKAENKLFKLAEVVRDEYIREISHNSASPPSNLETTVEMENQNTGDKLVRVSKAMTDENMGTSIGDQLVKAGSAQGRSILEGLLSPTAKRAPSTTSNSGLTTPPPSKKQKINSPRRPKS